MRKWMGIACDNVSLTAITHLAIVGVWLVEVGEPIHQSDELEEITFATRQDIIARANQMEPWSKSIVHGLAERDGI